MKKGWLLALLLVLCLSTAMAELPEQLTAIEESAFEGDAALKGVLYLPEMVETVGARAFAGTSIHGLVVPEGCRSVAADVLAQGNAAYVALDGADTAVSALTDVPYVFGPAGSAAAGVAGFYAHEDLAVADGFYFAIAQEEALPLCAVFPVTDEVRLPKVLGDQPVRSLDALTLRGCEDGAVSVPSYLNIPEGMNVTTYDAMTLMPPVPSVTECTAGDAVTWTTEAVTGAYGDVNYIWHFNTNGMVYSDVSAEPTITWSTANQGLCVASVTAVDALGDRVKATAEGVTVGEPIPVYRALLIGNTYPGTPELLEGCDTDVYAMRSMLSSMTGMNYSVTTRLNVNASTIRSLITTTFADARSCDVSLFYFSGHGSSSGSLVGIGNTSVTVSDLRASLDAIPGTKIVIVDCCYSGNLIGKSTDASDPSAFTSAFVSGFSSFTKGDNLATNGYVVMTACSKSQVSQSVSDGVITFGAFTYGMCYGSGYDEWHQSFLSSMPADKDGNGAITIGEAYSVAVDRVALLMSLLPENERGNQAAQYYGDTSYVLWSK